MAKVCERCGNKLGFLDLTPDNAEKLFGYKVLCNRCLKELHEEKEKSLEKEKMENEQNVEGLNEILFISSSLIENSVIEKYFDLITSEVVLGTGIFSELEGAISDLFGMRGSTFERKLKEAKHAAVNQLKIKAKELGSNAIISGKIDYEVIGQNMIMLVASGTPVILKEKRSNSDLH